MTQPSARAVQELHPRLGRKKFHQVLGGYVLLFFLFSFYGWLLETAHFVIRWGKLTDRGFLSLPLRPARGRGTCRRRVLRQTARHPPVGLFV